MKIDQILTFFLLLFVVACRQAPSVSDPAPPIFAINLEEITIEQLQAGYQDGSYTIKEVIQTYLDRIAAIDDAGPELNAIIQVNPDGYVNGERVETQRFEL